VANAAYEDEETPRRLGRYELIRRIAVGGMAEIYLARSAGLEGFEKLVVLKKILPQFASTPEFVAMFLDEARLVAGLSHPNIAQVYDMGLDAGGSYFFAMEFVDGEDVRQILRTSARRGKGALPVDLAIAISLGIAAGLHAAHERRGPDGKLVGIVHRDVSPSNVLVTYDGCVKLIDFGIAKSEGRRAVTRTGVLKGKSSYMSPEQTQGSALDRRSDVFAIGILLYEVTCGRRPFKGDNEYATMRDIVAKTPEAPSSLIKGYPKELEAVVMKCLEKDPGKRYQTTLQVQVALERFAREQQMLVSSVALAETMRELFADKLAPPPSVEPGKSVQLQRVLRSLTQSEREAAAARGEASASAPPAATRSPSEPREARESKPRPPTVTLPGVGQAGSNLSPLPAPPEGIDGGPGSDGSALDAAAVAAGGKSAAGHVSSAPLTLNSVSIMLPRPPSLFSVAEELTDTPTVLIEKRPLEPMVATRPVRRAKVGRAIVVAGMLGALIVAGAAVAGYRSSSSSSSSTAPASVPPAATAPVRSRYDEGNPGALPAPRVPQRISQDVAPVPVAAPVEAAPSKSRAEKKKARAARAADEAADSEDEASTSDAAADETTTSASDREAAARALLRGGNAASQTKAEKAEKDKEAPPAEKAKPEAAPAPAPAAPPPVDKTEKQEKQEKPAPASPAAQPATP